MQKKTISAADLLTKESTTSVYSGILKSLDSYVEIEARKYPLSDREKMLIDVVRQLLIAIDSDYRRQV